LFAIGRDDLRTRGICSKLRATNFNLTAFTQNSLLLSCLLGIRVSDEMNVLSSIKGTLIA
jgi:hypothetical protein